MIKFIEITMIAMIMLIMIMIMIMITIVKTFFDLYLN